MSDSNIPPLSSAPQPQFSENGADWKAITRFDANTTINERTSRVANHVAFGLGLYGAYSIFTGGLGLLPCLGLLLSARKIASSAVGYFAYPAARWSTFSGAKSEYRKIGQSSMEALGDLEFTAKKVSIVKSGIQYDATVITHSSTADNGKWTVHALGNGMAMEQLISQLAQENFQYGSNTLLINGPSVGESGGWPTRYQLGAGFEGGLQFLEQEVEATHILMRGLSLGGGMMAEAILNHDFELGLKRGTQYLSISDRTFSRLSDIAGQLFHPYVKPVLWAINMELDGVEAARKLSELNIRHIVVQHEMQHEGSHDGVIPDVTSLAHLLKQEEELNNKEFLESTSIFHNSPLPHSIQSQLDTELNQFFH